MTSGFTTLEYGDYIHSEATRLVAVLEALWGYFTLDVLVAGGIKTNLHTKTTTEIKGSRLAVSAALTLRSFARHLIPVLGERCLQATLLRHAL